MCDGVGEQALKPSRPEKQTTMATTAPANITTIARGPADYGRIAYVTTDGGHTAIEYHRAGTDGIIRPAQVVRVQFESERPAR